MRCYTCGGDSVTYVETGCPDLLGEPGDTLVVPVCQDCDAGINVHTEGVCTCPRIGSVGPGT